MKKKLLTEEFKPVVLQRRGPGLSDSDALFCRTVSNVRCPLTDSSRPPASSLADPYAIPELDLNSVPDPNSDPAPELDPDPDSNQDSDQDQSSNPEQDSYLDPESDTNPNSDPDSESDRNSYWDPESDPNPELLR